MSKIQSNQRLWKVIREVDGYYYEIRLAGIIVDRIKINDITYEKLQLMEAGLK